MIVPSGTSPERYCSRTTTPGLTTDFIGSCNRIYSVRATGTVTPSNQPPNANHGGPYTGLEGSPVAFDGSGSSDPDGDPLTFDWDFSDPSDPTAGSGPKPSSTYGDDGMFGVTLTVTDPAGCNRCGRYHRDDHKCISHRGSDYRPGGTRIGGH